MRFLTGAECTDWARGRSRPLDAQGKPEWRPQALHAIYCDLPHEGFRIYPLSLQIASSIVQRMPCLLWVVDWGVWPSSENWHLYYKLRQSYGDYRLLKEAPGHFCLNYQVEELASFLQLAILFGWDAHVLPEADYVTAFLCHDQWLEFYAQDPVNLNDVEAILANWKLKFSLRAPSGDERS